MLLIKIMDSSEYTVKHFSYLKINSKQTYMYICELHASTTAVLNTTGSNLVNLSMMS